MSWLVDLILVHILVLANIADKLVRMDVSFKMTGVNKGFPQPVVNFKADGQITYALVDTGAPYVFLVWKQWYENSHEDCKEFLFGCYECIPPCKQGPTKTYTFADHSAVSLFLHTGKLDFNGEVSTPLDFGLVAGFNRDPATIWASLGLGPSDPSTAPYKSIVELLFTKKIITGNSFSIYFTGGDDPSGQLILGGDDPSKHAGPLSYVQIVNKDQGSIQVLGLTIGSDPNNTIAMEMPADLDTGTAHICFNRKFKSRVVALLQSAGKKKVRIEDKGRYLSISCPDALNLPSVTFFVKGVRGEKVPLVILASSVVLMSQEDVCYICIIFDDAEEFTLGAIAFMGNYFHFDPENNEVGLVSLQ
ncbi:hypothetical protein FOL47_011305 [Perkinsus chesapeaki]|uniref:Peptidase A1 domain-containing protein n=1 Tax=Perkinsus chesapeaki TaxID=330153 RepID=A0A7J6KXX3_PERCH|nr:hypothetical protein FOL47_011305 [Perkinsus chesapeaki]